MKLFKTLLWVSLVLLVLVIAGVLVVTNILDPNDYKTQISEEVKKKTGRELHIEGDLKLTFFPKLGIETGKLSLSNALGFDNGPMLDIGSARFSMKIMPLLSSRIEIDTVLLENPRIRLMTQSDGRTNWDDIVTSFSTKTEKDNSSVDEGAIAIAGLVIEGVSVSGGEVSWQGHGVGDDIKFENINFETGRLVPGEPLDIKFNVDGSGSMLPTTGSLSLDTTLTLSDNFKTLGLDNTALMVSSDSISAEVNMSKILLAVDSRLTAMSQLKAQLTLAEQSISVSVPSINYDPSTESLQVSDLSLLHADNEVNLSVSASRILSKPVASGRIEAKSADVDDLLAQFDIEPLMANMAFGSLATSADFSFEGNVAEFNHLSLDAAINKVESKLSATGLSFDLDGGKMMVKSAIVEQDDFMLKLVASGANLMGGDGLMRVSGSLEAVVANLSTLLERNKITLELPPGLGQDVNTSLEFNLTDGSIDVNKLDIKTGDINVTGSANVGFENPMYGFDLDINSLNLDKLLNNQKTNDVPNTATKEQLLLPVASLQGLRVDGKARIGELITTGLTLTNVDVSVNSDDNIVKLDPLKADVAGGTVQVGLSYDVSADVPVMTLTNQAQSLNVGVLLETLEVTDKVDGIGNLDVDLVGQGIDIDAMIASLNGDMQFRLKDGALRGFDLQAALLKLQDNLAKYKGREMTETQKPEAETRFTELTGSFDIRQGIFINDDLSMKAPAFRVDGTGQINLPNTAIDYKLNINVVDTVEGQGGESLDNLKGKNIPLRIRGPLESPKYSLDVSRLLKEKAKKKLNKVLTKELGLEEESDTEVPSDVRKEPKEEIKDQLKKNLKKSLLKSLGFD